MIVQESLAKAAAKERAQAMEDIAMLESKWARPNDLEPADMDRIEAL